MDMEEEHQASIYAAELEARKDIFEIFMAVNTKIREHYDTEVSICLIDDGDDDKVGINLKFKRNGITMEEQVDIFLESDGFDKCECLDTIDAIVERWNKVRLV